MKLLHVSASNFGSFKNLDLNLDDMGLTLVDGETGSGKSTLLDAISWCLFGETPKDLPVSSVMTWGGNDSTYVELTVQVKDKIFMVTRKRGNSNYNDLYVLDGDKKIRGKDAAETQKVIEDIIGFDYFTFSILAYYTPHSLSAKFFESKASERRGLFERIAVLDLPNKVVERAVVNLKDVVKEIATLEVRSKAIEVKTQSADRLGKNLQRDSDKFEKDKEDAIHRLRRAGDGFRDEKAEKVQAELNKYQWFEESRQRDVNTALKALEGAKVARKLIPGTLCPHCGSIDQEALKLDNKIDQLNFKIDALKNAVNPHADRLEAAKNLQNSYDLMIQQEMSRINPVLAQISRNDQFLNDLRKENEETTTQKTELERLKQILENIQKAGTNLKSKIVSRIVESCQDLTNRLFTSYFDGLFRVELKVGDKDALNVDIFKGEHIIQYRQASKGEKCLLRLCLSIPLMILAGNKTGVDLNFMAFDEALDGLDAHFKIKAFSLFSELSLNKGSIFVVEHAGEIKDLFLSKIRVTIKNGVSEIENYT